MSATGPRLPDIDAPTAHAHFRLAALASALACETHFSRSMRPLKDSRAFIMAMDLAFQAAIWLK